MKNCILLFAILFAQTLSAQNTDNEGQQYIFPEFKKGVIYYKEGAAVREMLNYNLLTDEMQTINVKDKKDKLYDFDKIDYISIGLHRFIALESDFAEPVIETDEMALVVKRFTKTHGGSRSKVNKMLEKNEQLPESTTLIADSTYYLVRLVKQKGIKKGVFKGMSLSQNRVVDVSRSGYLKVYSDFKEEVIEFIDEENIDFKNPIDIIRLTEYCNKLK